MKERNIKEGLERAMEREAERGEGSGIVRDRGWREMGEWRKRKERGECEREVG